MPTLQEALASNDLDMIKKKRATFKWQLTNAINEFNGRLNMKEGKFDHVTVGEADLEALQEAILVLIPETGEATDDEAALGKEEQYYNEVITKVREALQMYSDYKNV